MFAVLDQVRTRTADLNDSLAAKYAMKPGDAPIGAFNLINELAVVAMELLTHYENEWQKIPAASVDAERRQEWAERIITLTKSTFVLGMSAIEFSAKQALIVRPKKVVLPKARRVYLGAIIQSSAKVGVTVTADAEGWEGVIEVRNLVVHNNGIADKSVTYPIAGGPNIVLVAGAMTKGNLRFFAELTLWSVEAFGRWSDGFLS